jgi:cation transport regulator
VPYARNRDLPDAVLGVLPEHAQEIYRKAFNSAWDEYENARDRRGQSSREETAHKVAWAAVKNVYVKGDDGRWRRRD